MASETHLSALRRKLDKLMAMDLVAMGYEAKIRHHRQVESARLAYEQALAGDDRACSCLPEDRDTSHKRTPQEQTTGVGPAY